MGLTSQYCGKNGGSCCNSCENDEEDEDDPVTIDAPPFSPNGGNQMPHGWVHTAYGIVNTRFPFVYSGSRYNGLRYNEADIFTVSPPLLHDVQAVLGCLLSRIRQYCDVQQSVSLRGWWVVPLGDADTVYSVNTVYLSISGSLCSISDLVHANSREVWRNTEAAYGFVASCRVLANNASLHSSRLLCWFRLPFNIGCGLNSLLYLPPSSGQPRGVSSVAAEEEHERGDSAYHTWG